MPTLREIGQLGEHSAVVFAYLALLTIFSIVLALGLWKTKKWAAWVTTAFVLYPLILDGYRIIVLIRLDESVSALVNHGLVPGFAWWTVYVVLLWAHLILDGLRFAANAIAQLRRERVPLQ